MTPLTLALALALAFVLLPSLASPLPPAPTQRLPPIVLPPTLAVPQITMNGTSMRVANISSEVYYDPAPWAAVAGCDPSQAARRSPAGAKAFFAIEVGGE